MRYRAIDVRIWGDEKFRSLTPLKPSGQALFLYLLTNLNTTSIPGLYRAGEAALAEELGWGPQDFKKSCQEVIDKGLVQADFNARVIFIPNVIKYNRPQSPNVVKSWRVVWDEIPECELKNTAYQQLKSFLERMGVSFLKAFENVIQLAKNPSANTMANQDQEQDQNQEKEQEEYICEVDATSPVDVIEKNSADSIEIFSYWQQVLNHSNAKLDRKRAGKIKAALKLGYSKEELKRAIDGCANTPFNMGENNKQQRFDDIELILRDAAHIDRFINNAEKSTSIDNVSMMMGVE